MERRLIFLLRLAEGFLNEELTTEGSSASDVFGNKKEECKVCVLNNKQTGHRMPSSQDVLPSRQHTNLEGGKRNGKSACPTNY